MLFLDKEDRDLEPFECQQTLFYRLDDIEDFCVRSES